MGHLWSLALTYAPALWQRRWVAITIAWVVCLFGWPVVALIPSHYVSSTEVYVDTHSLLEPLLSGIAVDIDPTQQVNILKETLTSEGNLERVVRVTNPNAATLSQASLDAAVREVQKNLKVDSTQDNVFTISYESLSPTMSQQVVQAFLNLFLEGNFGMIREDLDSAQSFLRKQVSQYDQRMHDADDALAHFKEANADILSRGLSYSDAVQKIQSDIDDLSAQIQDLNAKVSTYRSELNVVPKYGAARPGSITPTSTLDTRIEETETRLDNLRIRYTEKHPLVISTERSLANLKAQAAQERASGTVDPDEETSDVYQQLTLQLVDAQAQIAAATTQLARRKAALDSLKSVAARVPAIEEQMNHLKNEADTAHASYQELAARLQSANLSENRESEVNRVQFRVIDPPQVPTVPSGVKRSLLLAATLVLGIGLGLLVILALVLTQNTFVDATRLAQVINYPVLGSISRLEAPREMRLHLIKSGIFASSVLGLLIVFIILMLIERSVGVAVLIPDWIRNAIPGFGNAGAT